MIDYEEAFEAVEKINDELIDKYLDKYSGFPPLISITKAGYFFGISISIPGGVEFPLYNSENNDRKYYKKSDKYESFYKYTKRKFLEIKKQINEVKL